MLSIIRIDQNSFQEIKQNIECYATHILMMWFLNNHHLLLPNILYSCVLIRKF